MFQSKLKDVKRPKWKLGLLVSIAFLIQSVAVNAAIDPTSALSKLSRSISNQTSGRVNLSGYINAHYMDHRGVPELIGKNLNRPMLQLREASLFADVLVTDNLMFSTELEMSYDFSDTETSGRDDRFEALLNYYYFTYDLSDALDWDADEIGTVSLRGGRILVPFLQYNENKPNYKQNLMSQPFTAWQLAPVNDVAGSFKQFGWSDLGVSVNWSKIIADSGLLDVKLSMINGLGSESAILDNNTIQLDAGMMAPTVRPRDGLANANSDWDEFDDVNDEPAFAMKLSYAPFATPLNVGVSWYRGAWDPAAENDLTMWGAHLDYQQQRWGFKGEYVNADVEQRAGLNLVTAPGPGMLNRSTGDYDMEAWYLEAAVKGFEYGDGRYIKFILRYDDVSTSDKALFTPFNRKRITTGIEWEFLPKVRLRLETQRHSLTDYDKAPMPYINAGGREHIYMNMASIIAYF